MKRNRKVIKIFVAVIFCSLFLSNVDAYAASKTVTPSKPQISSVKLLSNSRAKITWKKATTAKKYELYVSINDNGYKKIKTTQATSYTQSNLKPGKTYLYKIKSVNETKKSGFSSVKKIKTLAMTKPEVTASVVDTTRTLKWNSVKNATGYIIYKETSDGYSKQCSTSDRIYKASNLKLSKTYKFKIVPYLKSNGKTFTGAAAVKSVSTGNTGYLLDIVQPYRTPYQYHDYNNTFFRMGGNSYTHGFTVMGYGDENIGNEVYFNLQGKYSKLSFVSGICDNTNYLNDARVYIYEDGILSLSYDIDQTILPKKYTLNIKDCMQLKICVYDGRGTAMYSSDFGFGDIKITK